MAAVHASPGKSISASGDWPTTGPQRLRLCDVAVGVHDRSARLRGSRRAPFGSTRDDGQAGLLELVASESRRQYEPLAGEFSLIRLGERVGRLEHLLSSVERRAIKLRCISLRKGQHRWIIDGQGRGLSQAIPSSFVEPSRFSAYKTRAKLRLACPRNVVSAFALTPAAIIRLAKVWWHSCKAIGFNPAARPIGEGTSSYRACREGPVGSSSDDEPGARGE